MYEVLSFVSAWSVVIPVIIGTIRLTRLNSDSLLIFSLVAIATVPQMTHAFSPRSTAEVLLYNLYTMIEFIFYFLLFYSKIQARSWKVSLVTLLVLYVLTCIYFIYRDGIISRFINELAVSNGITSLLIISYYLYHTLLKDEGDLAPKKPFFWFTVGILLYAACTTLVYALWQHILKNPNTVMESLWNLQNVFNVLTYILFSVGLSLNQKAIHNKTIPTVA